MGSFIDDVSPRAPTAASTDGYKVAHQFNVHELQKLCDAACRTNDPLAVQVLGLYSMVRGCPCAVSQAKL
jgi:hypothetical protein